ncbi:MAG: hypothetical protein AB7F28_05560 [Candidatus Margulisiibacteriota bacterium]
MAGIALLLVSYPLFYTQYKHYNLHHFPQDSPIYLRMAEHPFSNTETSPFRYRVLTPLLVKITPFIPTYHTTLESKLAPQTQALFFRFMVINYLWLLLSAVVIFELCYTQFGLSMGLSLLGGMAVLTAFTSISNGYIPMTDAGTLFFITTLFWVMKQNRPWLFLGLALVGVLQKETVIAVAVFLVILSFWKSDNPRRTWVFLGALIPAIMLYAGLKHLWPAPAFFGMETGDFGTGLQNLLNPNVLADKEALSQIGLGFLPFFMAGLTHLGLWIKGRSLTFPKAYLALFPILLIMGLYLGIGAGNIARVIGFGLPVFIPYALTVFSAVLSKKPKNKPRTRDNTQPPNRRPLRTVV